ncbi:MAG: hypothetical protein JOZ75_13515, partial [Candidatus Dormibacteraeota bacterium]|nr:hypothetical protein [Candidatus Dormibacteraeota bacterium]
MNGALTALLLALAAIAWLTRAVPVTLVAARMLQIEEYEDTRFLRWGLTRAWLAHTAVLAAAAIVALALLLAAIDPARGPEIIAAGWLVASVVGALLWSWSPPKKQLVLTARMRRVLGVTAAYGMLLAGATAALLGVGLWPIAGVLCVVVLACVPGLSQGLLVAADQSLRPVESLIRQGYVRRAKERFAQVSP